MAAPRSLDELMDRHPAAAVAISGAHHSSYTGYEEDVRPRMSATAHDGTILLNEDVLQRLDRICTRGEGPLDEQTLRADRDAVRVLLQRTAPLLSPEGYNYGSPRPESDRWGDVSSTPASITDAWAVDDRAVDEFIDALELDPRLKSVRLDPALTREDTARGIEGARAFADHLAERINASDRRVDPLDGREVLRRLAIEHPDNMLPVAARQLYRAEGFRQYPAGRFADLGATPAQIQTELEEALGHEFATLNSSGPSGDAWQQVEGPAAQPGPPSPERLVQTMRATTEWWHEQFATWPTRDAQQAAAFIDASPGAGGIGKPDPKALEKPAAGQPGTTRRTGLHR